MEVDEVQVGPPVRTGPISAVSRLHVGYFADSATWSTTLGLTKRTERNPFSLHVFPLRSEWIEFMAEQAPKTILIVDDDPAFREDFITVVRGAGYRALEAQNGRSALDTLDEFGRGIDLMVVDLCLPDDVSGFDIITAAHRRSIPVKIIAATAVFSDVYLDIARNLGANAAVRKPTHAELASRWLQLVRDLLGESASSSPLSNRVIVLTDDDDNVRAIVKTILQRSGYQVLEAADGRAALALIEKIGGGFDLLITDCEMPHLNGAGLVRAMRTRHPTVPVVYISGCPASSLGERLDDPDNRCAFVQKPFRPRQLLEVVTRMMPKAVQA